MVNISTKVKGQILIEFVFFVLSEVDHSVIETHRKVEIKLLFWENYLKMTKFIARLADKIQKVCEIKK